MGHFLENHQLIPAYLAKAAGMVEDEHIIPSMLVIIIIFQHYHQSGATQYSLSKSNGYLTVRQDILKIYLVPHFFATQPGFAAFRAPVAAYIHVWLIFCHTVCCSPLSFSLTVLTLIGFKLTSALFLSVLKGIPWKGGSQHHDPSTGSQHSAETKNR